MSRIDAARPGQGIPPHPRHPRGVRLRALVELGRIEVSALHGADRARDVTIPGVHDPPARAAARSRGMRRLSRRNGLERIEDGGELTVAPIWRMRRVPRRAGRRTLERGALAIATGRIFSSAHPPVWTRRRAPGWLTDTLARMGVARCGVGAPLSYGLLDREALRRRASDIAM